MAYLILLSHFLWGYAEFSAEYSVEVGDLTVSRFGGYGGDAFVGVLYKVYGCGKLGTIYVLGQCHSDIVFEQSSEMRGGQIADRGYFFRGHKLRIGVIFSYVKKRRL